MLYIYIQSETRVSEQVVEIDIVEVSLNTACLHSNANTNFNFPK